MKKIYISGPISGLDICEAISKFQEAEEYLTKTLNSVKAVNPMREVPYEEGKTWEQYMLDDIKILFECDVIFMLNGWEGSKGARIEYSIAKETGKDILFQE